MDASDSSPTEQEMFEHRGRAARLWCLPQHGQKVMDTDFAESIAQEFAKDATTLREERAAAAGMRKTLGSIATIRCGLNHPDDPGYLCCLHESFVASIAEEALSSDAGRAVLEEIAELKETIFQRNREIHAILARAEQAEAALREIRAECERIKLLHHQAESRIAFLGDETRKQFSDLADQDVALKSCREFLNELSDFLAWDSHPALGVLFRKAKEALASPGSGAEGRGGA